MVQNVYSMSLTQCMEPDSTAAINNILYVSCLTVIKVKMIGAASIYNFTLYSQMFTLINP